MEIAAAKFKATCLALMDEVQAKRTRIIITKNGEPVAELGPVRHTRQKKMTGLDFLYIGSGKIVGDIESPIVPLEDYEALK